MYMKIDTASEQFFIFIVIAGSSRNKFLKNIKQFFNTYTVGQIDATWLTNFNYSLNSVKKVKNQDLPKWLINNEHSRPYIIYGNVCEDICTLARLNGDRLDDFFIKSIRDYFKSHKNKYSFSKLRVGKCRFGNAPELFQNMEIIGHSHPYTHAPLDLIETNIKL